MSGFDIFRSADRPLPNRSTNFNYAIYIPDASDITPVDFVDQLCGLVSFGACGRQGNALYCAVCFKSKVGYHRVCKSIESIFPDIEFIVKSPMKLKPLGYIDAIRNDCEVMIVYEGGIIVEGRDKDEQQAQEEEGIQMQEEPIQLKEESIVPTGRRRRRKQDKHLVHRQPPPEEEGGLVIDEGLEEYYTADVQQNVPSHGGGIMTYPSTEQAKTSMPKQSKQDIVEGTKGNIAAQLGGKHLGGKGWIPIAPKTDAPRVGDSSLLASANITIGMIQNPSQEAVYSESEAWSAARVGWSGVKLPPHDAHSEGYRCEICLAWFKTLRMRSSHITSCRYKYGLARDGRIFDVRQRHLTKTGRGKQEDRESQLKKEYKCELCGKSFDRLRIRSSHMKSCREKGDRVNEVWNKQYRGKKRGRKGKKAMKVRELLQELMEAKADGSEDSSKQELEAAFKDDKVEVDSEEERQQKHSPERTNTANITEEEDVQGVMGNKPDKDTNVQGNAISDISEQGNTQTNSMEKGKEQSMMGATGKDAENSSDEKVCEITTETSKESEECGKATMDSDQTKEFEKLEERDEPRQPTLGSKLPLQQKNRRHLQGKSGLTCPFCQAKFSCKQRYQVHLDSHSVPERPPSPFKCTKCSAPFQSRKDLKIHSRIHNREGEHACGVCGAKFRQTQSRDRHLRKIHPEFVQQIKLENRERERRKKLNPIKAASCYLCGKPVADIDEYKIHMKEHRDMKRDVESRPFQCLVCLARYRDAKTIQLHMRNHTGREWEWHQLPDANTTQNVAGDSNPPTVQPQKEKTAEEREKDEDKLWKDLEKVVGLDLTQELKKHNLFKPCPKENNHKVAEASPKPKPVQAESSIRQIMVGMNQKIVPSCPDSSESQETKNTSSTEKPKVSPSTVTKAEGLEKRQKKRMQLHNIIANLKQVRSGQEGERPSLEQQAEESSGNNEWEKVQIKEEPLDHVTEPIPNMVSPMEEDPEVPNVMMQHGEDVPNIEPNISSFHFMVEETTENSVPAVTAEYSVSNTSSVPKPLEGNKELENLNTSLNAAIELSKELEPANEMEQAHGRTTESSRCSAKEVTSSGGGTEVKIEPGWDEGPSELQGDSGKMTSVTTEAAANRNESGGRGRRFGRGGRTRGRRGRRTSRNRNVEKDADYTIASDRTAPAKRARGKRKASVPRGGPGKRPRRSPRTPTKFKEPKEVVLTKKDHKKSLKKSPMLLDLLGKSGNKIRTANLQAAEGSVAVNADIRGNKEIAGKVIMVEGVGKEGQNVADQTTSAVVHQKNCSCCANQLHLAFPNKVNMRAMVDQRPFYCNICGARYNEEATLRMHMRLHPPGSQPMTPLHKNEQGQFICVVCGGKFNDKEELIRHSRIHPLLY